MKIKRTVFRPNGQLNTHDTYDTAMVQRNTRVAEHVLPLLSEGVTVVSLTRTDGFREEYTKEIA